MTMFNTYTNTYTVVDIRKTFEGFEADMRMIARRTGKWSSDYVDNIIFDIILLAEKKYLHTVDIALLDSNNKAVRASKFIVNENGKAITAERAGGNDWIEIPNTELTVILSYSSSWKSLSELERENFRRLNSFRINWVSSNIDNSFPYLKKSTGQLYASNGFELQKENYK
jgi:Bacterial HORMA domain family 1